MATSETELVNTALVRIGETRPIANLDNETSDAGEHSRRLYPQLRDSLLRKYQWNFAITRLELTSDPENVPPFGFRNAFRVPTNVVRVIGLYDEFEPEQNYTTSRDVFKIEGEFLLTNRDAPLQVFVVQQITNVAKFDPAFTEALAWLLASQLAYPLSAGADLMAEAKKGFVTAMNEARLADAVEGWPELQQASDWVDSRQQFGATGAFGFGPRRFP